MVKRRKNSPPSLEKRGWGRFEEYGEQNEKN
jgi:hypothetical protein